MEPREFVENELVVVNHMFNRHKQLYPAVVLIKDDRRYLYPVPLSGNVQKDIVSQGIKDLVRTAKPDVVVYIAEAWMLVLKSVTDRLTTPSESKDRIEIVVAQIEFKSGEKFGCQAKIIREPSKVYLDKFDIIEGDTSMGRFCDFFPIKRTN